MNKLIASLIFVTSISNFASGTCVFKLNTNSPGQSTGAFTTSDPFRCATSCTQQVGCVSAVFDGSSNTCWLKQQTDAEVAAPGVYTIYCGNSCVFKKDFNSPGASTGSFTIADQHQCADSCIHKAGCVSAVFDSSTKTCWLKQQTDAEITSAGFYSIYCGLPCVHKPNTNSPGQSTGSFSSPDRFQCAYSCMKQDGCVSTVFDSNAKTCWLKQQTDAEVPSTGFYTGYCSNSCVWKANTNSPGANTGSFTIADQYQCGNACWAKVGCVAAVFDSTTNTCWLKSQTDAEIGSAGFYSIYCGPPAC